MRVRVRLYAGLYQQVPEAILTAAATSQRAGSPLEVSLPAGSTVADLVAHLGLPPGDVRVTFVNGISRSEDHPLAADDRVGLFPAIGGG